MCREIDVRSTVRTTSHEVASFGRCLIHWGYVSALHDEDRSLSSALVILPIFSFSRAVSVANSRSEHWDALRPSRGYRKFDESNQKTVCKFDKFQQPPSRLVSPSFHRRRGRVRRGTGYSANIVLASLSSRVARLCPSAASHHLSESLQAAARKHSKKQSHDHKHSDTKNGRSVAGRPSSERKRIHALRTGYIQVQLVQIKGGRDKFQRLNGFRQWIKQSSKCIIGK